MSPASLRRRVARLAGHRAHGGPPVVRYADEDAPGVIWDHPPWGEGARPIQPEADAGRLVILVHYDEVRL